MSEMSTFSSNNSTVTVWDIYLTAARCMFGDDIEVIRTAHISNILNNLCFNLVVVASDQQVTEKTQTTVDITTKEYTNCSDKDVDETLVKVKKHYIAAKENQYYFSPTNGVNLGMGANIGAKVMGLSMGGGSALVGGIHNKYKSREENFQADFRYSYEHEERIKIPPQSRVNVKITTYAIKYEQSYTLRFSIPASYSLQVKYKTKFNQICCCSNTGYITAAQLFQTLPSFHEQNGMARFYQHGILSWMGEGSNIEKKIEQKGPTDLLQ